MNIKIELIPLEQKSVFIQLFNLYSYDFTEYTNVDIGEDGYLNNDYANKSWIDEELHHFLIRVNGKIAGFMIIGDGSYLYLEDNNAHHIDEFFIMKKYRRMGVGSYAAKAAFDMFKGKWEVCQMQNNLPARRFWKSVIFEYTKNNYQECGTEKDEMVGFIFDNSQCIEKIKNTLKEMLDDTRFTHTIAVCETAVILAERFGADKEKAYLTALLHDCARGLDFEQQLKYCKENNIDLDDYMKNDINPVHALIGADMAKKKFGIEDTEILNAIYRHATGCEDMTLLDKIIFVADGIEPNRDGEDADEARIAADNDLDKAIAPVMRIKTYYLKGKPMHPNSVKMLQQYKGDLYEKY